MTTLGDSILSEMKRVREEVLPYYTPEVNGQFAAYMMNEALTRAEKALAEQDTVALLECLEELKGFTT